MKVTKMKSILGIGLAICFLLIAISLSTTTLQPVLKEKNVLDEKTLARNAEIEKSIEEAKQKQLSALNVQSNEFKIDSNVWVNASEEERRIMAVSNYPYDSVSMMDVMESYCEFVIPTAEPDPDSDDYLITYNCIGIDNDLGFTYWRFAVGNDYDFDSLDDASRLLIGLVLSQN